MTDAEQVLRDLLGIIDDAPASFTWNNAAYDCRRGPLITSEKLAGDEGGGWMTDYDLSVTTTIQRIDESEAAVARFDGYDSTTIAAALQQQKVTLGSAVYRVEKVTLDEYGQGLQLDLMSIHK